MFRAAQPFSPQEACWGNELLPSATAAVCLDVCYLNMGKKGKVKGIWQILFPGETLM